MTYTNKTAVLTMVYNEPHFMPMWSKYYSSQVGASNCYVVDHGSDDGSTENLGLINKIRIPRSPMDDFKRSKFISELASSLLHWYENIIYVDSDEFLVANPFKYGNLDDYCSANQNSVVTAFGLNIHQIKTDLPLVDNLSILSQRSFARFAAAMCKPLITKIPINWTPGFHSSDHETVFNDIFLMHLHHYDTQNSLKRLNKTRNMQWATLSAGSHQRVSDEEYTLMVNAIAGLSIVSASENSFNLFVEDRIKKFINAKSLPAEEMNQNLAGLDNQLIELPNEFKQVF